MAERTACKCMSPPLDYRDFEPHPASEQFSDDRHGGEITVETCRHCGTHWLHYFVEYPAFTSSGRWCRGVVIDDELFKLTAHNDLSGELALVPWR